MIKNILYVIIPVVLLGTYFALKSPENPDLSADIANNIDLSENRDTTSDSSDSQQSSNKKNSSGRRTKDKKNIKGSSKKIQKSLKRKNKVSVKKKPSVRKRGAVEDNSTYDNSDRSTNRNRNNRSSSQSVSYNDRKPQRRRQVIDGASKQRDAISNGLNSESEIDSLSGFFGGLSSSDSFNGQTVDPDTGQLSDNKSGVSDEESDNSDNKKNQAPVVSASSDKYSLAPGETVNITSNATDFENDTLLYSWNDSCGAVFENNGSFISWTAPDSAGECIVSVEVSDSISTSTGDIVLTVRLPENEPTVVTLEIVNGTAETSVGGTVNFHAVAVDPEEGALQYVFNKTCGQLSANDASSGWTIWTAPDEEGSCEISVSVINGSYNVEDAVTVMVGPKVNSPPESNLTSSTVKVRPGGTINLKSNATDSDSETLSYAWSTDCGILLDDNAPDTVWVAPNTEKTCVVDLTVDDGAAFVSKSISLDSKIPLSTNIAPQVSISASKTLVNFQETINISAAATDADDDQLTYFWSKTCGELNNDNSAEVSWTAPSPPASQANCQVSVLVGDGNDGSAEDSILFEFIDENNVVSASAISRINFENEHDKNKYVRIAIKFSTVMKVSGYDPFASIDIRTEGVYLPPITGKTKYSWKNGNTILQVDLAYSPFANISGLVVKVDDKILDANGAKPANTPFNVSMGVADATFDILGVEVVEIDSTGLGTLVLDVTLPSEILKNNAMFDLNSYLFEYYGWNIKILAIVENETNDGLLVTLTGNKGDPEGNKWVNTWVGKEITITIRNVKKFSVDQSFPTSMLEEVAIKSFIVIEPVSSEE